MMEAAHSSTAIPLRLHRYSNDTNNSINYQQSHMQMIPVITVLNDTLVKTTQIA